MAESTYCQIGVTTETRQVKKTSKEGLVTSVFAESMTVDGVTKCMY